jgi:hypothetical protein
MFNWKGFTTGIKYAIQMNKKIKIQSAQNNLKLKYASTLAMVTASSYLINPNVMNIINLRELILKSRSESECSSESIENMLTLSCLNQLTSISVIQSKRI